MPNTYDIDGVIVNVINPMLGQGGQGLAEQVALSSDPSTGLVLKHLPMTEAARKRVKYLVDQNLPLLSPFLAAPIAANVDGGHEIIHLAPFAPGHDLLSDNRTLPEMFEIGFLLMCLLTILEENGLAHGDISPSNIIITQNGDVYLIDFDNFAAVDLDVPPPMMAGQHMIMAPEIRGESGETPNMKSDRFAYAGILNLLFLRRHAAGDAQVPSDLDIALSSGIWPERHYSPDPGDVPIAALGERLPALFDTAFSLDPDQRPSADDWRRTIGDALHNLVIHDCGEAFVHTHGQTSCPWCQSTIESTIKPHISAIKLTIPILGTKYEMQLRDGARIILGRQNLGNSSPSVSGKHLEITPVGQRLFLRHIGRNPSQMLLDGKWHKLESYWLDLNEIVKSPITMKLADLQVDIGV